MNQYITEENFEEEVERTVAALKAGKTILYPTDTIWGVGCDATNNKACLRVYAVKQRPLNKSLIILVDSVERLQDYVVSVPAIAYDLIKGAALEEKKQGLVNNWLIDKVKITNIKINANYRNCSFVQKSGIPE